MTIKCTHFRGIGELTEESDTMSFKDIVPPSTYRSVAAKIFSVCLGKSLLAKSSNAILNTRKTH